MNCSFLTWGCIDLRTTGGQVEIGVMIVPEVAAPMDVEVAAPMDEMEIADEDISRPQNMPEAIFKLLAAGLVRSKARLGMSVHRLAKAKTIRRNEMSVKEEKRALKSHIERFKANADLNALLAAGNVHSEKLDMVIELVKTTGNVQKEKLDMLTDMMTKILASTASSSSAPSTASSHAQPVGSAAPSLDVQDFKYTCSLCAVGHNHAHRQTCCGDEVYLCTTCVAQTFYDSVRKFEYTPFCHFCRKAWNDDARQDALDTIDGIWDARHTGKTGSVKLCHSADLDGHGFHRRIRLTETDEWKGGMMISDSFRLPMDDVSLEGDSIHGLVSKYMNNQWPIRRRTVLRITAKMGEEVSRGVYVFNRFRNSFWSEPCIELDCGIHGIDEKTCIPVSSIKSLQIIKTWNDTMPVVIRDFEFFMDWPHPAIIQVKRGPVMCVDHVWLSYCMGGFALDADGA